jgi:hypothetical protein
VRRAELLRDEPEHPRAEEPYFKVQLGPVVPLPHAIRSARWKRFTFVYTTGDRLLAAQNVVDLTIASATERDRLWRTLRDRPMWTPRLSPPRICIMKRPRSAHGVREARWDSS